LANAIKLRCRVAVVLARGQGTYLLELEPLSRVPRFRSGQFLHLTVDDYDPAGGFWPESRVFSIASRYGSDRIKVVYSVKGKYTGIMEKRLRPGLELWIKLPFGDFNIESRLRSESDAVLVAGGTGLSPYVPFLEELAEGPRAERRIRLFYGIRNQGQLLFGELLAGCADKGIIDAQVWLEEGASIDGLALPARTGRLDPSAVLEECHDLRDPVFFLSGPPAMIANFKATLIKKGLEPDRIQTDEWE
jgi:NAD(P)H-flavin reductase